MSEELYREQIIKFLSGLKKLESMGLGSKKFGEIKIEELTLDIARKAVLKEMQEKMGDKIVSDIVKEIVSKLLKKVKEEEAPAELEEIKEELGEIIEWTNVA